MLRRTLRLKYYHIVSCLALVLLQTTSAVKSPSGDVVELTDATFDAITKDGVWLVDVYAPWCSHCRQLEPIWQNVAKEGSAKSVHVAKIDGTAERILLQRFSVNAFPSIFLLRDGKTWQYAGSRSAKAILEFATTGYKTSKPEPFFKAPNGLYGRLRGKFYSLPVYARKLYHYLKEQRGYSDLLIMAIILGIPVFIGAVLICVVDAIYTHRSLDHAHQD